MERDSPLSLDSAGMHFAFVPMTLARAVTVGTVLGYTVLYTVRYTTTGSE